MTEIIGTFIIGVVLFAMWAYNTGLYDDKKLPTIENGFDDE